MRVVGTSTKAAPARAAIMPMAFPFTPPPTATTATRRPARLASWIAASSSGLPKARGCLELSEEACAK